MSAVLRVGVVGAGVFAGYHSAKVAAHDRATLTGIFDLDAERAATLAQQRGVHALPSLSALAEQSDAVIIATPASAHRDAAVQALQDGCHVLVEKPLAINIRQGEAILEAKGDRVVQVGHQERLVAEAIGLHTIPVRPKQIEIVRHGPRSTRNLDASIVMDLMIHDLDLLHGLFGKPSWISTEAARCIYSSHLDEVRAEIGFSDMVAYVSASRDAELDRRWILRYETGTVEIDFAAKTLRNDTPYPLDDAFGETPDVQDSLAAAFDRFVRACLDGTPPLASGEDGLAAVRMACAIEGDV